MHWVDSYAAYAAESRTYGEKVAKQAAQPTQTSDESFEQLAAEVDAANGAKPMGFDQMTGGHAAQAEAAAAADFEDSGPMQLGSKTFQTGKPKLTTGNVGVPRLRLAQGLTAEVSAQAARSGQFVLSGYDAVDEVVLVPLMYNESRERRRPQHEDPNRSVACKSDDTIWGVGDPGNENRKSNIPCIQCPFSQWTPKRTDPTKNDPPACKLQFTYISWSLTHEMMVSYTFQSTAEQAANQVALFAQMRGLGNFAIKLTSTTRQAGRNSYFVPVPTFYKATREQLGVAQEFLALPSGS